MSDKIMTDFAYDMAKKEFLSQISYHQALIGGLEEQIEERSKELSKHKIKLAAYRYCLDKLEEDFIK